MVFSKVFAVCVVSAIAALGVATFGLDMNKDSPDVVHATGTNCAPARSHASGNFNEMIVSGALTRDYILRVPPSYTGTDRSPLVLSLHGTDGLAQPFLKYTELAVKAHAEGFILVIPQAILLPDPFGIRQWNFTTIAAHPADDVAFIADLLDDLESRLCIDPARIYATGISSGGLMSVRLACSLSDRIAAIAPVVGVYWPPVVLEVSEPADCPAKIRPVPVIAFHGTDDLHFPFLGGTLLVSGSTLRLTVEEAIAEWAANNGCVTGPTDSPAAPGVRRHRYEDCSDEAIVELYVVEDADGDGPGTEGGGHTWPGASFDLRQIDPSFGLTTQEIVANDLMWDFFKVHPKDALTAPKPTKQPEPGDTDGDGCSDQRENGLDETLGGLRNPHNPNDFYDVLGGGGGPPDQIIDLTNDIFGVIQHYAPTGTEPEYDVNFDRGPSAGPNPWNMTAPDGVIDLTNDILGVILQYLHSCQ